MEETFLEQALQVLPALTNQRPVLLVLTNQRAVLRPVITGPVTGADIVTMEGTWCGQPPARSGVSVVTAHY